MFSYFGVKNSTVRFDGDSTAQRMGCVGTLTETMNNKTVTKKCEGVVKKSKTKGDGTGEIAFTLHMRRDVFLKSYGMETKGLKAGVYSYGQGSSHKEFCYTSHVLDEDDVELFVAYPRCVITSAMSHKIENGAEEVAEIECTASVMPDEYGQGKYEALADDLDEVTRSQWLENFSRTLVSDIDTFEVSMTVTPADGAKVTIVNAQGSNVGVCSVNTETGEVNIPNLEVGEYTYIVYATGYQPKTGTITVGATDIVVGNVNLTKV